jgi:TatD DNase family protein
VTGLLACWYATLDGTETAAIEAATATWYVNILDKAAVVSHRRDPQLLWGCGVHPGVGAALDSFDRERFERLAEQFVLVGEVGMDAHAGRRDRQRQVPTEILTSVAVRPMLVSVHSSGWPDQVVDLLAARPPRGPILYWFTGGASTVRRAVEIGCFFSVNEAMADAQLAALPADRILPETDTPAARRRGSPAHPGDVDQLEGRLAHLWGIDPGMVQVCLWPTSGSSCSRSTRWIGSRTRSPIT